MPHAPLGTILTGAGAGAGLGLEGCPIGVGDKLRAAAIKGRTDRVLELLASGTTCTDVADRAGRTALHFACHCGHADVVAALILAGCDVNTPDFSGHTALQRAAAEGYAIIVQQLLKHGAKIDHQDDLHGNTALHEAAWKGFSRTVDCLCKAKANAYVKNKGGFVPLHLACQNGHNQTCRVLLWSGCRPDLKNNYGDTPLHAAARYGHAGVMRILISARCNVNEKNKNGDTAIHISSAMGRRKLTRILLESDCDQNIQNKQGESPIDISRRKRFAEVVNILTNPPPLRTQLTDPVTAENATVENAIGGGESTKQQKKREKELSGTSKDSKDSGSRHRAGKTKKSKRGHKDHHGHGHHVHSCHQDKKTGHASSPYGCQHYNASAMMRPIQNLKLDTLPDEPLGHGEQYFLDLAGNIRKGPLGVGYACYCVPFFRNVEKKMENDKQELIEHIDLAHDNLNAKITHLERRTRTQLTTINEGMKERLAAGKAECLEHVDRVIDATRRRAVFINGSNLPPPHDDVSSSSTSEEDEDYADFIHPRLEKTKVPFERTFVEVDRAAKASSQVQFSRSKSEELLLDSKSGIHPHLSNKPSPIGVADTEDRDSGYTTKLHSSFESSSPTAGVRPVSQVPRLPPRNVVSRSTNHDLLHGSNRTGLQSINTIADEFSDIDGQFVHTVNNETEKWYARRLQSIERGRMAEQSDDRLYNHRLRQNDNPSSFCLPIKTNSSLV